MRDRIENRKRIRKIGALVVLGIFLATMLVPAPVVAQSDNDWNFVGTNSLAMGYPGADKPGNCGIGTNNPTSKLHVVGDVKIDSGDLNVDSGALFVDNNNNRVGIGTTTPDNPLELLSATTPQLRITNNDATDYATFAVDTDGQLDITTVDGGGTGGHICLMPDGNVGIGTTTPGAKLDVEVSSGGAATIGNYQCSATGDYAIAMGYGTTAIGEYSTAMGWDTTAIGDYSTAMGGQDTEASGDGSIAMGYMAEASGFVSQAIGFDVEASGVYSCAIGSWVTAGPAYSTYVIGRGADAYNPLVNNIEKSFMVGFDSTTPTLFVDGSSVGIGTTNPGRKLEVRESTNPQLRLTQSDAFYTDLQTTSSGYLYINPSGARIGVGTTSPTATLDVDPTVTITSDYKGIRSDIRFDPPGTGNTMTNWYGMYVASPTVGSGDSITNRCAFVTEADAGNVGIGTTSPDHTLHVEGDVYITGSLYDKNNLAGTNGQILKSTGSQIEWVNPSSVSDDDWTVSGDDMYSAVSGNIGIGTTSPKAKLEVSGLIRSTDLDSQPTAGAGVDLFYNSVAGIGTIRAFDYTSRVYKDLIIRGNTIKLQNANSPAIYIDPSGPPKVGVGMTNPGSRLEVKGIDTTSATSALHVTNGAGTSLLFVRDDGNVGIGTTNPDHPLHILSAISADSILKIDTSSADYDSGIRLAEADTDKWFINNDGDDSDKLKIASTGGLASETRFTIQQDGNVGIGTTNPGAKLTVVDGAILASGATGETPTSGAGTRLMWIPAKNAFRAGDVSGTHWDNPNIGFNSFAVGHDTIAKMYSSVAMGMGSTASGYVSTAIGYDNTASGDYSVAMGTEMTVVGKNSFGINLDRYTPQAIYQTNTMAIMGGNVGIGTTYPDARLDIDAGAIEMMEISDPGDCVVGALRIFARNDNGETKLAYLDGIGKTTQLESPFLKYHYEEGSCSQSTWQTIIDVSGPWVFYAGHVFCDLDEGGYIRITADGEEHTGRVQWDVVQLNGHNWVGDGLFSILYTSAGVPGGIKAGGSTSLKIEIKADSGDTIDYHFSYGHGN